MQQAGEQLGEDHSEHLPWVQGIQKEGSPTLTPSQGEERGSSREWGSAQQVLTSKKRPQIHSCKSDGVKLGLYPGGIRADLSPPSGGDTSSVASNKLVPNHIRVHGRAMPGGCPPPQEPAERRVALPRALVPILRPRRAADAPVIPCNANGGIPPAAQDRSRPSTSSQDAATGQKTEPIPRGSTSKG